MSYLLKNKFCTIKTGTNNERTRYDSTELFRIIGITMFLKKVFLKKAAIITALLIAMAFTTQNVFAAADMTKKDPCYKGIEAYITGQFNTAMGIFKKVAKKKDACSQFQLGMMYYYGHGVKKSNKSAKNWFKKSSSNGFKKAVTQLSLMKKKKS